MFGQKLYFIGLRYQHHSNHSGYDGFCRYVGVQLKPPVNFRFMTSYRGWKIDTAIAGLTSRPYYTLGSLLTEGAAALHMACHRKSLYHLIYGDTDLWLLSKIKMITKNRLIATFHDPPASLEYLAIDKQITQNLAAVILVSQSQRSYFIEHVPPERIFVVPHGIDTSFFQPPLTRNNELNCIVVGSHMRDFETLKRAMQLIWQVKPKVRLFAVGTRRPNDPNPYLDLDDHRVDFFDGVNDEQIRQLYQTSSVAVLPLREATANNALLEAMACGLPIIATDIGGVKEYVGDQAGILCKPQVPESFANGVLKLLDDFSLAKQMSQASRNRALEFDYRVVADKMKKVYSAIFTTNSA
jgi:glycosyltransferase involved in cell wall biosynthesis